MVLMNHLNLKYLYFNIVKHKRSISYSISSGISFGAFLNYYKIINYEKITYFNAYIGFGGCL